MEKMPRAMTFGLVLALACALATSVSFLLKQRGAVSAPAVRVWHPLRSAVGLFRSKWFAVGWLVALVADSCNLGLPGCETLLMVSFPLWRF